MTAYLISDVEIRNPEEFRAYQGQVAATVARYGGRYLARGGGLRVLEGDVSPTRIVLVEFPSIELAQQWYDSPEYRTILPIRQRHARTHLLALVDGT